MPGQTVRAGTVLVRLEERETDGALAGSAGRASMPRSASLALAKKNRARFERLDERGRRGRRGARPGDAGRSLGVRRGRVGARRCAPARGDRSRAGGAGGSLRRRRRREDGLAGRPGGAGPAARAARLGVGPPRRSRARRGRKRALVKPGDALEVVIGGRTITGRVAEIVGAVDPSTRRRTVRVDLPAGVEPPIGSFARLLLAGPAAPRLLVSERAVVARGGLEIAWAVGPDGARGAALRPDRRPRRAVRSRSARASQAGERVVLDPPADLEAGTRVSS